MERTQSENSVTEINSNLFFKEFTYGTTDFTDVNKKQSLEFADNVVWLDDIFILFEIKERKNHLTKGEEKWFENKVLNKAVKQIKKTHKYFHDFPAITLKNEKGHTKNISETNLEDVQNVIIYSASDNFSEQKRLIKFHESRTVGLIHLFHTEDYYWICRYLSTPAEVKEYLIFRENLFLAQQGILNKLPEQYILGHFLETLDTSIIEPKFIENLGLVDQELFDFNISNIIENFNNKIKLLSLQTEYYPIISEIAKMNRAELAEFKKRFIRSTEKCKEGEREIPYRMYLPRTDCAFVFIPMTKEDSIHWKIALRNYTEAQKYDQKAFKSIGVVIYEDAIEGEVFFEMYWMYIEAEWVFNEQMEELLTRSFPFREVKMKQVNNRYKD